MVAGDTSLEIRGLEKSWGDFSLKVDLSVAEGETLVLAGPSGCGKTTILNLIAGLLQEDRGEILIDGENAARLPPWKRNISVVFQDLALFPHLNVGNNVAYPSFIKGIKAAERRRIVDEALRTDRFPGHAQGGRDSP